MSLFLPSPQEMARHIMKQMQAKRLSLNLSQQTLSKRSGVSFGTLKKYERTGKISVESLLKIAWVLGCLQDFQDIFKATPLEQFSSIEELLKDKTRQRGRQ